MSTSKFTLYSFAGSQWAQVAHLAIAEKSVPSTDYDLVNIDLINAANFDATYLTINPYGTIPSLTCPSLTRPIIESRDILQYIDIRYGEEGLLTKASEVVMERTEKIVTLVHQPRLDTNIILLQARDTTKLADKASSMWFDFIVNRQNMLETFKEKYPEYPFYQVKLEENTRLYNIYTTKAGEENQTFFSQTHDDYRAFAQGMRELDRLLVLPYAAGERITEADFHVIPWLAHAMWGAGTEPTDMYNLEVLESLIRKSDPGFAVGEKLKEWWRNIAATDAFKAMYPRLH